MQHILLVEDDPFLIDVYSTKLKEAGFEVSVAKDGQEVFEKLKEKKPSLMLLDIVLPNIDGWEVLKKISNNPNLKDLKIIILSNLGEKSEVEKGLEMGAVKYLIKSHYTPSQIIDEIKEVLE